MSCLFLVKNPAFHTVYDQRQHILQTLRDCSKHQQVDICPPYTLQSTLLVNSVVPRSFFTQDENVHTCFECPLPGNNNTLGVVNVLCGFLLAINECGHLNDASRTNNSNLLSIFDVILKSILFKHSIDFAVVMENCERSPVSVICNTQRRLHVRFEFTTTKIVYTRN